jgi:hypothetical protein
LNWISTLARHDVAGAGAAVDVGDLPGRRREVLVALIPFGVGEFGEGRSGFDGSDFSPEMRVGDVPLDALDRQLASDSEPRRPFLIGVADGDSTAVGSPTTQ